MQKLFVLFLLLFSLSTSGIAQLTYEENSDTIHIPIINNEHVIKNDMLFDVIFEKIKKPLILVNNEPVYTLAYYNREEFKKITVLQPKEAYSKYRSKGKNGVIIAELNDNVISPEVEILTNKIYYGCKINGESSDVSKEYYDAHLQDCVTLDLRDTGSVQTLYIPSNGKTEYINKIKIKNLGVGWDRAIISVKGGIMSGTGNYRDIRVNKVGIVTIGITTQSWNKNKFKEITFRAIKMPAIPDIK